MPVFRANHGRPRPRSATSASSSRRVSSPRPCSPRACDDPPAPAARPAFGLLRHLTRLSGATLYLPRPELLPLRDLPIFGRLSAISTDAQIHASLAMVRRAGGGCLELILPGPTGAAVKALGGRLADALEAHEFPPGVPLVLLVAANVGKALGAYVSRWGRLPVTLIVLDELAPRGGHFVHIGRMREQMVPVSFYGMGRSDEEAR